MDNPPEFTFKSDEAKKLWEARQEHEKRAKEEELREWEKAKEQAPTKVDALKTALISGPLETAMEALCSLDELLTGSKQSIYRGNTRDRQEMQEELKKLMTYKPRGTKVYLSDGGHSRLLIDLKQESCSLQITPNATDRVKFLFPTN